MGEKNRARLMLGEQPGNHLHRTAQMRRVFREGHGIDFFQTGFFKAEAEPGAGVFEFLQARAPPFFVAAQRDGDVDDSHSRLAQKPDRKTAGDALVIGMRRKNQRDRRAGRRCGLLLRGDAAQRQLFAGGGESGIFCDKLAIWISSN